MTPELWQLIGSVIVALVGGTFLKTLFDGRQGKRLHLREIKQDDYKALKDDNQRMLQEREEAQKDAREARLEAQEARTQREVMRQAYEREATWSAMLERMLVRHDVDVPPRPPLAPPEQL
jgi:Skp family chaperone for outer membrane proteins